MGGFRGSALRVGGGVGLVVLFLGSVISIVAIRPLELGPLVVLLAVAGASAAVFSAYYLPNQLDERVKRAVIVGAGCITLLTAVLALRPGQEPPVLPADPLTATPSAEPADPLTATLGFGSECENFAVPTPLLASLPPDAELDAQWVYEHNGATSDRVMSLAIQGKTEDAVMLHRLRVVDLRAQDPPTDVADIFPCGRIRREVVPVRYFEVDLRDPAQVVPRPAPAPDPQTGKVEPAKTFPFQVSNTNPEFFVLVVSGQACFCDWRLALDWTSGGRSGTITVDHGFGKIRTDTSLDSERIQYAQRRDGTWDPPLPK